ncbi:hypothetical protein IHE45_20G000800 [Dioscorea alata]|uniref:Uncharacterized protein n=1 Tax=Dioscorea alata TaxID=55571 RepID=A0ACB7TN83_DIOAL|nr:hypothetical protein IHE45_20G000800 [Dioscorea alata]
MNRQTSIYSIITQSSKQLFCNLLFFFFLSITSNYIKMFGGYFPVCIQCGTRSNPCRCKVVGPTVGFLAFAAAAVVEWPVGAFVYLFRHVKGRRIMAHPAAVVYPSVTNAIPI